MGPMACTTSDDKREAEEVLRRREDLGSPLSRLSEDLREEFEEPAVVEDLRQTHEQRQREQHGRGGDRYCLEVGPVQLEGLIEDAHEALRLEVRSQSHPLACVSGPSHARSAL